MKMNNTKHIMLIAIWMFGLTCPNPSKAAPTYRSYGYTHTNLITLHGSVGYSTLLEDYDPLKTKGATGATLGLGYELRSNHFWFGTGAECQYLSMEGQVQMDPHDESVYDTQKKQVLYHYVFNDIQSNQRFIYANIPIELGYYKVGFYVGAGIKLGYNFYAKDYSTLEYTTSATYYNYIVDLSDMPNHGYSNYVRECQDNLNAKFKVSAIAEIGYDVFAIPRGLKRISHSGLKIGAYVEYGLNNIFTNEEELPVYEINRFNASDLSLTSYYKATPTYSHHIRPLYAGVKITYFFCPEGNDCGCQFERR